MTTIDHAAEARRNIESLHDYQAEQGSTDESMLTVAIEAQAHATLALAEQQRIANTNARASNLVALYTVPTAEIAGAMKKGGIDFMEVLVQLRKDMGL